MINIFEEFLWSLSFRTFLLLHTTVAEEKGYGWSLRVSFACSRGPPQALLAATEKQIESMLRTPQSGLGSVPWSLRIQQGIQSHLVWTVPGYKSQRRK